MNKPPLGLSPRFLHDERRMIDIDQAIRRYLMAFMAIPVEWIEERNEIIERLAKKNES